MERRKFTREFKLEDVKLIKKGGVSYVQAAREIILRVGFPRRLGAATL